MSQLVRVLIVSLVASLTVCAADELRAQATGLAVPSADNSFTHAVAKESAVRKVLAAPSPPRTVLRAVRTVVEDYEAFVRRYPGSNHSDDALWRAALLSDEAFRALGEERERTVAARLLSLLAASYPTSTYVSQVAPALARLSAAPLLAPPAPTPQPVAPGGIATIRAIRRALLQDIVRVVIELDSEVEFRNERIENPARVFVDLPSTKPLPALLDQTLRFDGDNAPVRQIRLGRHPNNTTRVVLEAEGISSYSIYPLYSPYRLVIDCLREQPLRQPSDTASPPARSEGSPTAAPAAESAPQPAAATRPDPIGTTTSAPMIPPPGDSLPAAPARNTTGGFSIARQLGLSVSRIVIDPGHGGSDSGARSRNVTEAALVLDVALRLEKLLSKLPGVQVILTRRDDVYVSLQERTAIANREGADLFLSIHANAHNSPQVQGVETYFLNFATTLDAAAVAARENAASGQQMGALPDMVKTIALNNKLDESRDLATHVQRALLAQLKPANATLRDLGVKQAPFVVLIGAAMPSVLTEIAFLTNPAEAKRLKSGAYKQRIAEALFRAIRQYQSALKKTAPASQRSQR